MTQQGIFELMLGSSSYNVENENHLYPPLIAEAADVVTEQLTDILYNSLKRKSDYRRLNILKLLQNLASNEKGHLSVNEKNCECVLKHLENTNTHKESDLKIYLDECELEVKKHKLQLHEKIINIQKKLYSRQKEINILTDFRTNRQREKLNKLGINASLPQTRAVYEPNEKVIKQLFGINDQVVPETINIHDEVDKTTSEFRFKQVKFGYAINNISNQFEVKRHMEIILENLKKYDQLYDCEKLFLRHIYRNIEKFPDSVAVLCDNFWFILEISAIQLCTQIIQLSEAEVQTFLDNVGNIDDFLIFKKVCSNDHWIKKIKNIFYILYFHSYCNSNILELMEKVLE